MVRSLSVAAGRAKTLDSGSGLRPRPRPLILVLAALGWAAAAGGTAWAQASSDENAADRLAQWDREVQELKNRLDDLQRELNNATIDAAVEQERFASGGLLPGFSEFRRQLDYLVPFERLDLMGSSGSKSFTCSNVYGATYEVPFGSYDGNQIIDIQETKATSPPFILNLSLGAVGGAWSFEPGALLLRTDELASAIVNAPDANGQPSVSCTSYLRYRYLSNKGDYTFTPQGLNDTACSYTVANSSDPTACGAPLLGGARFPAPCVPPTLFQSTQGQVVLDAGNPAAPVVRFPDGSVEVMGNAASDWSAFGPTQQAQPFFAHHQPLYSLGIPAGLSVERYWTTDHRLDRNGNRSSFQYDGNTRQLVSTRDALGRVTTYTRDGNGNVTTITQPAFGGSQPPLTWTLTWTPLTWARPESTFGEIQCYQGNQVVGCPSSSFTTLTQLTLPDGRSYGFSYGDWGNLLQVTLPSGGAVAFGYGDSSTVALVPPSWQFTDLQGNSHFLDHCPDGTISLFQRRLVTTTEYPMGLPTTGNPNVPAYVTTTQHKSEASYLQTPTLGACFHVQTIKTTFPDGKVRKRGICNSGFRGGSSALNGRIFSEETFDGAGNLREATYFGNPGTIGDTQTAAGTMYMTWENTTAGLHFPANPADYDLDVRPTKMVHVKDGVLWTETMTYDVGPVPANGTDFRTLGNVAAAALSDSTGTVVKTINSTYVTAPAYLAQNLVRLPATVKVSDGTGKLLARTDYAYDGADLVTSGAPNLENPGTARGNPTSVTMYTDAKHAAGPLTTSRAYYDDGQVQKIVDPRGLATTYNRPQGDFAECAAHPTATQVVTNPKGQSVTTVSDCVSGQPLTVTDANGQVTASTYDRLSRVKTVTAPGDPSASRSTSYYLLGSNANDGGQAVTAIAQQRTVTVTKDGSASGLYVKTFTDGFARPVQARTKVDPATSGGNAEMVRSTDYDSMGRITRLQVSCFDAARDSKQDCAGGAGTVTLYDVLGRPVSVAAPGLPAAITGYSGDGVNFIATVTPPNGSSQEAVTKTDVLGHVIEVDRLWSGCSCLLPTVMSYDAAGRLLSVRDPQGNQTTYTYDDAGRRLTMTDPDMGGFANLGWTYAYDNDGNLLSQTDPKGQTITMSYDELNRITLEDLPPAGPGEEDEVFYYDGTLPTTCYSCDDHCPTTVDTCNTVSLTCTHTGTPCVPTCPVTLSPAGNPGAPAAASAGNTVQVFAGCPWTASSNASWITISSGAPGSGNGMVVYSLAANPGSSPRTGSMTIAGLAFNVTQAAAGSGCTGTLSAARQGFTSAGGSGSVGVTDGAGCSWTAVASDGWITITGGASGTGNGSVTWAVAANATAANRAATLTIAGQTFAVTQAGGITPAAATASATLAGSSPTFAVDGDPTTVWSSGVAPPASIDVDLGASYDVSALRLLVSQQPSGATTHEIWGGPSETSLALLTTLSGTTTSGSWLQPTFSPAAPGIRFVRVKTTASPSTVAWAEIEVYGTPSSACTGMLSPAGATVPAGASSGNTVSVTASCSWTAISNSPWLTVTSGASGSGGGTVTYSVTANTSTQPRTGSLTIAGQSFGVTQQGATPGNFSVALVAAQDRYVEVPSAPGIDVTGPFTVEAWVDTDNPGAAQQGIVERFNQFAGNDGGFALRLVGGKVQFWVIDSASSSARARGSSVITPGWHHVAGVFDGAQLSVYLDGGLDGSAASSLLPVPGTASLKIGAQGNDASNPFDGWIDEARLSLGTVYTGNFAPQPHLGAVPGTTLGLWRFDDQTANDSSGNGNHGVFRNGAVPDPNHPEYGSLALDGVSGYFEVPDSSSLKVANRITLSAWIKTTSNSLLQQILVHGGTTGVYGLKLLANGRLKMSITGGGVADTMTGNSVIPAGVWTHVAAVYDGSQMSLYVNGALDNSKPSSVGLSADASTLRIGAASDGTALFSGNIDEVLVSSKVVYSGNFTPATHQVWVPGTVGLWRFDNAYGSDASGWMNHGNFFGGAGIGQDVPP